MTYTHTIVGNLPSQSITKIAILKLEKVGFDINKLSVIGKNSQTNPSGRGLQLWQNRSQDLSGGLFSMLAGAGMLFIRDVGLIVIAGPIAGVLAGWLKKVVVNQDGQTAFGGIIGALGALGISQHEALRSEAQIKAGEFVILAAGSDRELYQVRQVLAEIIDEITLPMAI